MPPGAASGVGAAGVNIGGGCNTAAAGGGCTDGGRAVAPGGAPGANIGGGCIAAVVGGAPTLGAAPGAAVIGTVDPPIDIL